VLARIEHRAGERDRAAELGHRTDRTDALRGAVHHGGVGLDGAVARERRAEAGIELGIVLEHAHRGDRGIERAAARREDRVARRGRRAHPGAQPLVALGRDAARAAVHDDAGHRSAAQRKPTMTCRAVGSRPCVYAPRPTPPQSSHAEPFTAA